MNSRAWVFGALFGAWAVAAGCANTRDVAGRVDTREAPPSFTSQDAATVVPEAGLTEYCPSSVCPAPFTTCPGSQFLCDVNLSNDPANCGSCGFTCPEDGVLGGKFQCAGGKCVLKCTTTPSLTADCDGILDNGCEVALGSNDNCQACGDKCTDPDKPCITNTTKKTSRCGCDPGLTYCSTSFPERCIDTKYSDKNCGGCNRVCPNDAEAGPPPPNAHYGCVESECGHLKCDAGYLDCDGDLLLPSSNGCEAAVDDASSCGGCGNVCDPSQSCGHVNDEYRCLCGPGEKDCGAGSNPYCVAIDSDPFNCGGCGIWCGAYYLVDGIKLSHYVPSCVLGSCSFGCAPGWGDCNGQLEDGCEVNLGSDPKNCGGCGITCDAVHDQACIAGRCALEPCSTDGGLAR